MRHITIPILLLLILSQISFSDLLYSREAEEEQVLNDSRISGESLMLLSEIRSAADGDFFDRALELIGDGMKRYPLDYRFPMILGELYEEQELYSLALAAFRDAESLDSGSSTELRRLMASTLAYLDMNSESLSYLESLVDEGELSLLDDLGWMYYKTHQPEKGIIRLGESLEKKFDRNLSLTLGTLYSEINSPELCRRYYLDAIEDALKHEDSYFASVGYYNLSLAEKSFYDYEAAEDYASRSLELMDRAAGHLALGDLYMMKQSFREAEREFREAVDLDKTPLSRTNLASLYRIQGRLDDALIEIRKVEKENDGSWMYYYGLNQNQFMLDLYRQLYEAYEGKVQLRRLLGELSFRGGLERLAGIAYDRSRALYYRLLHRLLSLREGAAQKRGGAELRGNLTLASGASGFGRLSGKYYQMALDLEGFSRARPWYDLVLGSERRDPDLLARAERGLDRLWERQPLEDLLRQRVLLMRPNDRERSHLKQQMYRMNPGSLIQYGLRLPVELQLDGEQWGGIRRIRIRRLLRRSGFTLTGDSDFILRIQLTDSLHYTMNDKRSSLLFSGTMEREPGLPVDLKSWVREFRQEVFQF